jgi:hypothetical protein
MPCTVAPLRGASLCIGTRGDGLGKVGLEVEDDARLPQKVFPVITGFRNSGVIAENAAPFSAAFVTSPVGLQYQRRGHGSRPGGTAGFPDPSSAHWLRMRWVRRALH